MNRTALNHKARSLVFTVLLGAGLTGMGVADSLKVAVISDADGQNLAALVATELSSRPDIVLVERDELAKVGDEAEIQTLAGQDAVALGKLVGADGLVFISTQDGAATVRLTSVSLGYALLDEPLPAGGDPRAEAKSIAHRVGAYAEKFKLLPAQVIPISVLNLRADFPTADATELERHLTLLLESRLAAEPRYVVLERRHAWSLGFERSLSTKPGALIPGSYVVDGTIDLLSTGTSALTVRLRLRSSDGREVDASVAGSSGDLPAFVEKLVAEIGKTTGASATAAAWQPEQEAREYLLEGVWGWQHQANTEALEALDSAELLGEKARQLHTVRVAVLCALAADGINIENYFIRLPEVSDTQLADAKTALILRAIDEVIQCHEPGNAADDAIGPGLRDATRYIRPDDLVIDLATNLLVLLDRDSPHDSAEVRRELRKLTLYDPLHGTMGPHYAHGYIGVRDQRANEWPMTLEEQLASYRLICSAPNQFVPSSFLNGEKTFCPRFLVTPGQQAAAFQAFVESLKTLPGARLSYLLLEAASTDHAQADAAYREWLSALWPDRDSFATSVYDPRWASARELPSGVLARNAAAGLPLLHYTLQHRADLYGNDPPLFLLWHPEAWNAADAAKIWSEFTAYENRVRQKWIAKDRNVENLDGEFEPYATSFLKSFPNFAAAAPAQAPTALIATRFWYPWRANPWPQEWFNYGIMDQDAQGLWLIGFNEVDHPSLFHVSLADFSTQIIPVPDGHYAQQVKVAPGALFLTWETHGHDGSAQIAHEIARYDFATGQWSTHDLPTYSDCQVYSVGDTLYFFMRTFSMPGSEGAIARYDWDADKLTILSSTRRRPAQNQFDDRQMLNQVQIFAGPGGKPCAATDDGVVYLQETPGTWPFVFDCSFWDHAILSDAFTLVQNQYGEATLIDPKSNEVEHLMAASTPFVRKKPVPGPRVVRVQTPWAAQTLWDAPAGHTWYNMMAYGAGRLFILNPPAQKGGAYDLMVYTRTGGRAPRHVPLEFRLSDADRPALSTRLPHAPALWQPGWIEHPDTTKYPSGDVQFFATAQGLVIQPVNVGFWFIPYADIDAWLKAHFAATSSSISK
jgi:hypothetical protein